MGEWLSRSKGQIIPPFEKCQIIGQAIIHPKDPVELWRKEALQPMVREKEHVLRFIVAGRKYATNVVRCAYPYDMEEIMRMGREMLDVIPELPAAIPELPAQP
jgi:hypothetical protein